MRILILEDQLDFLECLRSYFRDRGHEVHTACTAEEALALLNHLEPDWAFIDLILAKGTGHQVIREIAKRRLSTRTVVITGCDDLALRKELLALGVSDYLFKPITFRDIEALMAPEPETP